MMDEMLACMFSTWYKTFSHVTLDSRVIDLPPQLIDYLMSDGTLVLPHHHTPAATPADNSDDDDNDDWTTSTTAALTEPEFPEFYADVSHCIMELGGRVLPKLNWSAPRDAKWVSYNGSLECTTLNDILLLFKCSEFITHDLQQLLYSYSESSTATISTSSSSTNTAATSPIQAAAATGSSCGSREQLLKPQLVLRRWVNIPDSEEFRCFVYKRRLIGICQRNHTVFFPHLSGIFPEISHHIQEFYKSEIAERFPLESFVFDVWCDASSTVTLIDFNPFSTVTDSLLFTWEELKELSTNESAVSVVVRCVEESGIQSCPMTRYAMPVDLLDLTTGTDMRKFIDLISLNEKGIRTNYDSSSSSSSSCADDESNK